MSRGLLYLFLSSQTFLFYDFFAFRTEIPDLSEGESVSLPPRKKRRKRTRKFY